MWQKLVRDASFLGCFGDKAAGGEGVSMSSEASDVGDSGVTPQDTSSVHDRMSKISWESSMVVTASSSKERSFCTFSSTYTKSRVVRMPCGRACLASRRISSRHCDNLGMIVDLRQQVVCCYQQTNVSHSNTVTGRRTDEMPRHGTAVWCGRDLSLITILHSLKGFSNKISKCKEDTDVGAVQ
ncbi:hypothetical protein E2C01_020069 [Portunus trituberculatus]|uniref:Uncharacterized protein n=1 Tax=Portunus trituberculatus TaxID=210409 RepID=A0A5B7DZK1_PORTR|nr:hypothetical protein [Portunus trituberculatus]